MGYYSTFDGELVFSRPLNGRETRALKPALNNNWSVYELITEHEERETDEGVLTVVQTTGIRPREDQLKAYEWQRVLQDMVNALPEDVTVSGYIERSGEESPDLERLYVRGRAVVSVKPEIVWPEPS